jgi:uncharacterized protein YdbL (DUF1318 family)
MKLLIVISMLSLFSAHAFAAKDKVMVGENASGYARCMADVVDCTSGCDKKCENLNPEQYKQDVSQKRQVKHKKGSAGKQ